MAIYNYKCKKCKKSFDLRRSMEDSNKDAKCECGGTAKKDFLNSMKDTTVGVPKSETADFPYTGKRKK